MTIYYLPPREGAGDVFYFLVEGAAFFSDADISITFFHGDLDDQTSLSGGLSSTGREKTSEANPKSTTPRTFLENVSRCVSGGDYPSDVGYSTSSCKLRTPKSCNVFFFAVPISPTIRLVGLDY